MVEKIILTRGTTIRIIFSRLSKPLLLLSSRLKTVSEDASRNKVYIMTILFRRMSVITYLIILFIIYCHYLCYRSNQPFFTRVHAQLFYTFMEDQVTILHVNYPAYQVI